MLEYIVLAHFMAEMLDLEPDAVGLCMFGVFAAHWCNDFLENLASHRMRYLYLLQSASANGSVCNEPFKEHLKQLFCSWMH